MLTVKTIITTNIPKHDAPFSMDIQTNSGGWTSLCTTSTCVAGTNDFAGASDLLSVTFNQLQITYSGASSLVFGVCEVWAYSFKNYAPLSTISFSWDSSLMDSKSYAITNAATPFAYMASGIMNGAKSS